MKKILSVFLAIVMLFSACILPVQAEEEFIFESDHPYETEKRSFYVYEYETECEGFFVTFDEKTSVAPHGWLTPPQPDWTMSDVYKNYIYGDTIEIYQNYEEVSFAHLIDDEYALNEFLEEYYYYGDYDDLDYDRMVIYKYDDYDLYSGTELAGKTIYIKGHNLAIEIDSNSERTDYGFAVDYIGDVIPEGKKYVHYNIGADSYYDFFSDEEGVFVNSKEIQYIDNYYVNKIVGWATESGGEKVYDGVGYIEDGETATNFIAYTGENIELYPIVEKVAYTVTYEIFDELVYDTFSIDEEMYVSSRYDLYFDQIIFRGWSEQKNATEVQYLSGDILEENRDYVLYPVFITLNTSLIDLDDCWNFHNYSGYVMDMDAKYDMMIRNAVKTWSINPLLWVPAAIYTASVARDYEYAGGHCFGMALTVILNHYGYIDLLEGRDEVCVADLPLDAHTDSIIHYYHSIQTQGILCDQFATENNTNLYRKQAKNMCDSIKAGNVVQLSPSWYNLNMTDVKENTVYFGGHSMVLLAVTDIEPIHLYPYIENEENVDLIETGVVCDKIITVYDSNSPGRYEYIYVAEDYSYMVYESTVFGAFRWGDDFSHFESFDHNGDSKPLSWHIAVIKNIFRWIETFFSFIFRGKVA